MICTVRSFGNLAIMEKLNMQLNYNNCILHPTNIYLSVRCYMP